jgi:transposase InsO family protein
MPLPHKDYYALTEVEQRWGMRRLDSAYFAENGRIELAIRTHELDVVTGTAAHPKAPWGRSTERTWRHEGLLPLRPGDLSAILRRGYYVVSEFKVEPGRFLSVCPPSAPVRVQPVDLLITDSEVTRFEEEFGLSHHSSDAPPGSRQLQHTADFSEVIANGRPFRFRGVQATIVRHLHDSAVQGKPWVSGKQLLRDAGSQSTRLLDVFKRHPNWRDLIESDGCGAYCLKLPGRLARS